MNDLSVLFGIVIMMIFITTLLIMYGTTNRATLLFAYLGYGFEASLSVYVY